MKNNRKINFVLLILLMAINVSFASCEGNNSGNSPQIYVVGYIGEEDRDTLWINGEPQSLSEDLSRAFSVFVSGSNVYIAGTVYSVNVNLRIFNHYSNPRATLWTNGIPEPLSDIRSEAYSVFVSNNRVYVAGSTIDTSNNTTATIWIDGIQRTISTDRNSSTDSIFVSGNDLYVTGTTEVVGFNQHRARIWINGLPQILYEERTSYADSVFISGNDIYVAGTVYVLLQGDRYLSSRATLWVNGIQQILSENNSSATSIYVEGNNVYVAGNIGGVATLWINGVPQTLSDDDEHSYAEAKSVFVLNGIIYVAGSVDNKATLWINGELHTLSDEPSEALSVFVR